MDREEAIKKLMGGYDEVWLKAIQAKRAAKSGASDANEKPLSENDESPGEETGEDNDTDDGMNEETKAQLLELLSQ